MKIPPEKLKELEPVFASFRAAIKHAAQVELEQAKKAEELEQAKKAEDLKRIAPDSFIRIVIAYLVAFLIMIIVALW